MSMRKRPGSLVRTVASNLVGCSHAVEDTWRDFPLARGVRARRSFYFIEFCGDPAGADTICPDSE